MNSCNKNKSVRTLAHTRRMHDHAQAQTDLIQPCTSPCNRTRKHAQARVDSLKGTKLPVNDVHALHRRSKLPQTWPKPWCRFCSALIDNWGSKPKIEPQDTAMASSPCLRQEVTGKTNKVKIRKRSSRQGRQKRVTKLQMKHARTDQLTA